MGRQLANSKRVLSEAVGHHRIPVVHRAGEMHVEDERPDDVMTPAVLVDRLVAKERVHG